MARVVIILQARMASTRLAGKSAKEVLGRPLLSYMIERLSRTKTVDDIIVATSENPLDDRIAAICQEEQIPVFRGSEEDVLLRYYEAAKASSASVIVRVTGDCPLIDPEIIDHVVTTFLENGFDYVSNTIMERTYPRGMDTEVFSFEALEKAAVEAKSPYEREHVTPYFYQHPELFDLKSIKNDEDLSHYRLTVDTQDDFILISMILDTLYRRKHDFNLKDIIDLMKENPQWEKINANVQQNPACECPED